MSLYTVSSESSACCSPNDNLIREASTGVTKGNPNPRSFGRLHSNDSNKPESASAVVRVVAADYSKQMEAMRDRTSALERYKILVNKARRTPVKTRNSGIAESTLPHSEPLAAQEKAADGSKINDVATTATVIHRTTAGSTGNTSPSSHNDRRSTKGRLTTYTKQVEGMREDAPQSAADSNSSAASFQGLAPKTEGGIHVPSKDDDRRPGEPDKELFDTTDHKPSHKEPNAQPPTLPEPIEFPSNPKRDSMRPDYEPITSRHNIHDRTHSLDSSNLLLKSDANLDVPLNSSVGGNSLSDQNVCPPHADEQELQRPSKALKTGQAAAAKRQVVRKSTKEENLNELHQAGPNEERISGNGSQTAFWIRPSSALYEMTASIGAKRKDSARMDVSNEGESVERARVGTSRSGKNPSEASLQDRRPRFSTFFSSHRAPAKGVDSKTSKMSVRSSNPTAPNSCLVSPRDHSLSYDLSALAKPFPCNSFPPVDSQSPSISVVLLSRKNIQDTSLNQPVSSRRKLLPTSDSSQSSLGLLSTEERPKGSVVKGKAVAARPSRREGNVHVGEVPAASNVTPKQPASAIKLSKASPKTMQRKSSVNFDTSQSETSEPMGDPTPDGLPPKATPLNLSSSVILSARSSCSATSMKGRANPSIMTPISTPKSSARAKSDVASPLGGFLVNDGKRNLNNTPTGKDAVGFSQSKLRGRTDTNTITHHIPSADSSIIEMNKENICDKNGYPSDLNRHPKGRLSTLGTRQQLSANEMVGSMLQGIIQQTRRVLPCYLCGEMINATTYHVHMEICRRTTEVLMEEHAMPSTVWEKIESISTMNVPISSSSQEERDAFAMACYKCALHLVIPCRICGIRIRIHDAKEHEMLCGKTYYDNSKAAQRVRRAADEILSHAANAE
ncbi:unnamed protein product [Phytomonas sp. EM1]|nr:unnamed protein product [Phytomonas sp. EM1]|eukprot:CCW60385.1 unnamed protein product [Phytomonas sp. isolate EM1]